MSETMSLTLVPAETDLLQRTIADAVGVSRRRLRVWCDAAKVTRESETHGLPMSHRAALAPLRRPLRIEEVARLAAARGLTHKILRAFVKQEINGAQPRHKRNLTRFVEDALPVLRDLNENGYDSLDEMSGSVAITNEEALREVAVEVGRLHKRVNDVARRKGPRPLTKYDRLVLPAREEESK